MEPRDLVRAALASEPTERPPAAWWGHTYREEWSPAELAAITVARQRTYGWDFVKLQPRACCFAQAFGCEYVPSPDGTAAPVQVRPVVVEPEDWQRLRAVDATVPPLLDQVEALASVVRALGPSVPVLQTVFSPLTVAGYLIGGDKARIVEELRRDPERISPALARIADTLSDFVDRSIDAGAAGIFYAISGYASADLLTQDEYELLAFPHDRRVLAARPAGTWFDVLHLCGSRVHFDLAARLDLPVVSWSVHEPGNPSLAEGRERIGRAVMGGIDQTRTLPRGSAQDVRAEAEAAVRTAGRGLLLAPGCSVPPESPEENLRAVTGPPVS